MIAQAFDRVLDWERNQMHTTLANVLLGMVRDEIRSPGAPIEYASAVHVRFTHSEKVLPQAVSERVDCLVCGRMVPFTIGGTCKPCDDTPANTEVKIRSRIKQLSAQRDAAADALTKASAAIDSARFASVVDQVLSTKVPFSSTPEPKA